MKFPCPTHVNCPGTDLPISNYSSEGPDSPLFIGFSSGFWPANKPKIGTPWQNPDGFVYCLSPAGQADAQRCANNGWPDQWGSNGSNPGNPGNPGDGGGTGTNTFSSNQQQCAYTCPDGTQFVWTVASGYARSSINQATADNIANSLACRLAIAHKICLSALDNKFACAGSGYFGTISASVGTLATLPLTWTIVSGSLPPGVELDTSTGGDPDQSKTVGLIGTVSQSAFGAYTFTLRATDAGGNFLQKSFTISVGVIAACPSNATQSISYSFQMQLNGGTAPFTWTVSSGSLPAGLSMDTNGLITGTPTSSGLSSFTISVMDANKLACSKTCSINVSQACTIIGPEIQGVGGQQIVLWNRGAPPDGTLPWTATVVAGSLPPGLSITTFTIPGLFTQAFIGGTPTTLGHYTFTVRATPSGGGASDDTTYCLAIVPSGYSCTTDISALSWSDHSDVDMTSTGAGTSATVTGQGTGGAGIGCPQSCYSQTSITNSGPVAYNLVLTTQFSGNLEDSGELGTCHVYILVDGNIVADTTKGGPSFTGTIQYTLTLNPGQSATIKFQSDMFMCGVGGTYQANSTIQCN